MARTTPCTVYDELMTSQDVSKIGQSEIPEKIQENILIQKDALQLSPTATLWLQYMYMIDLLKMYLKGDRLGDLLLHLKATALMLPYFAASGHQLPKIILSVSATNA